MAHEGQRKLDGSWAGGKGSYRRKGEDSEAYAKGWDAIFGEKKQDPTPKQPTSPALLAQWRSELDQLARNVDIAKQALTEAQEEVHKFLEGKDELR